MNNIIYRDAVKEDTKEVGKLIYIASGGLIEYLFQNLIPFISAQQILNKLVSMDNNTFSYKHCFVAEAADKVVAAINLYPAHKFELDEHGKKMLPKDRIDYVEHFFSNTVDDSIYIDSLAVTPEYQGQGIAGKLIEYAKQKAQEDNLSAVSLIVWADNESAIHLYQKHGFETVKKFPLPKNPAIPHKPEAILMQCALN